MIYQKEDKLIKGLAKYYGQHLFDYLEALEKQTGKIQEPLPCTKIKRIYPTDMITPNFKELLMDFVYEMEDGSYTHYEHYSGNLTHGNLIHTGRYDIELHEETGKLINTIIISTGNPDKSEIEAWIGKVNKYTPIRIIFLKKYPGDQRLKNVKIKIENNEKLTHFDILDLILIPFLNTTKSSEEIVKEICSYVGKITKISAEQIKMLTWGLWLTTEIFIKNPKTLEKVRSMSKLKGESINEKLHNRETELREEGREEGRKEGIKKGIKEGREEGKTTIMNAIKTLEKEGKTAKEILTTLKTTF